jgi:hypothetical protein
MLPYKNGYQQADVALLFRKLYAERQFTQHFLAKLPIHALGRTGWHAKEDYGRSPKRSIIWPATTTCITSKFARMRAAYAAGK